jgi:hypothetical protein
MKTFSIKLLSLVAGLLLLNMVSCQSPAKQGGENSKMDTIPQTFATAAEAAKSGIDVLKALVSNKNINSSFSLTEAEVNELRVGSGLVVEEVSFNKLVALNADSSLISSALMPSAGMTFPLQTKDKVRSTVFVSGAADKWKLTDAGQSGFILLFEMQNQLPKENVLTGEKSILHIPSLGINCIASKGANGIIYLPDNSLPETRIIKGKPMAEKEFSKEIISYAKRFYEKNREAIDGRKLTD